MSIAFPIKPETAAPLKSLEGLAYILRHKELWPEGFVWDYRRCGQCALGLAYALFNHDPDGACTYGLELMFNSKIADHKLFTELGIRLTKDMGDITPEDVADAIDGMLAKQGMAA